MGLLKPRKHDPISERAQALNARIAALEAEIQHLGSQLEPGAPQRPGARAQRAPRGAPGRKAEGPVFEPVDHERVTAPEPRPPSDGHFNELGVRKYDLAAAWRRVRQHFRGPASDNPRLINYLAAGSIKGLRPMRYEKRVARNRVIALTLLLLVALLGIVAALYRH